MQINEIIDKLIAEFPSDTILDGDRIGLQVSSTSPDIKHVLVAYELTDEVVVEAVNNNADMIISFHPLIYYPLSNITDDDRVGRIVRQLVLNDIALYVIHTNFDTHTDGTNSIIADKLKLLNRDIFVKSDDSINNSIGIIGNLSNSFSSSELAELLSGVFNSHIRYCFGRTEKILRIAVLGGSGSSFVKNALKADIDAYITADISYHTFHQCKGRLALFDVGHYEMEQFNSLKMNSIISNLFSDEDITFLNSKTITNPVKYHCDQDYQKKKNSTYFK